MNEEREARTMKRYRVTMKGTEVVKVEEAGEPAGVLVLELDSEQPVSTENVIPAIMAGMGLSDEMREVAAALATLAR